MGGDDHSYSMAKQKKVSVSLGEDEIMVLAQTLEEAMDKVFCDDPDCQECVMAYITVSTFVDRLYQKAPKIVI
jgi:hypothetical protein